MLEPHDFRDCDPRILVSALENRAPAPIGSASEFIKENVNVVEQYKDYFSSGEVKSIDEISRNSGALIRDGLKKIAVYRDDAGTVSGQWIAEQSSRSHQPWA